MTETVSFDFQAGERLMSWAIHHTALAALVRRCIVMVNIDCRVWLLKERSGI